MTFSRAEELAIREDVFRARVLHAYAGACTVRLPRNRNARPSPTLLAQQSDKFARRSGPIEAANV